MGFRLLSVLRKSSLTDHKWGLSFDPGSCGRCVPLSSPPRSLTPAPPLAPSFPQLSEQLLKGSSGLHPHGQLLRCILKVGVDLSQSGCNYRGQYQHSKKRKRGVVDFRLGYIVHYVLGKKVEY